ncbi:hypothetical protein B0H14DRAFT_2625563 [Mycena olivaceomarginata]|nr:hypothetical protein B0H14DRAFT_2625563 [Mycena olivaceomarginata]
MCEDDILTPHGGTTSFNLCCDQGPQHYNPCYCLCVGEAGQRSLWLSINLYKSDEAPDPPALWASPAIDFDEALGFTVAGNLFGELVIYNHSGQDPGRSRHPCTAAAPDLAPDLVSDPHGRNYIVTWSQDNLNLDDQWSTTWLESGTPIYPSIDEWHGTPGDWAWMLEHAYGFPGRVLPQAFQDDPLTDRRQNIIFCLGTRYFSYHSDKYEF